VATADKSARAQLEGDDVLFGLKEAFVDHVRHSGVIGVGLGVPTGNSMDVMEVGGSWC
jgi:hypothetical protein